LQQLHQAAEDGSGQKAGVTPALICALRARRFSWRTPNQRFRGLFHNLVNLTFCEV
jgi:hypothetical protein